MGVGERLAVKGDVAVYDSPRLRDRIVWLHLSKTATGRLEVADLLLFGTEQSGPITGETLRDLQIGRIEAALNSPDFAEKIRGGLPEQKAITGWLDNLDDLLAGKLELDKATASTRSKSARRRKPPLKVGYPGAAKKPDEFYEKVARAYSWLIYTGSNRPAVELAQANEVPATTIHRWVKEARRRGFLPSGQRESSEALRSMEGMDR
jgi:hypothetical protein